MMLDCDIVVYTAIFDNYDFLLPPRNPNDSLDYICFTDNPNMESDIWDFRIVSDEEDSPKLQSGKYKTLPHRFLPEYKYSIWVDGNIHIHGNLTDLANKYVPETDLAVPPHPDRDCLYDEAQACVNLNKSDPEATAKQMQRYRKAGFPENFGLSETRILIRNHSAENVVNTMECWWKEYRDGANRDQLSFEYAAWETGLNYESLDIRYDNKSEYFHIYPHKPPGFISEKCMEYMIKATLNTPTKFKRVIWLSFLYPYFVIRKFERFIS
ncbi:glycosyltransferase domain-containing protein [Haloferax sp. YSMS24]|uniref:glycosyltransferase domain-containing protein n=1 Tax=Haloferax sp. YSMS24 TaxID=3388425 RepID=UPI00398CDA72